MRACPNEHSKAMAPRTGGSSQCMTDAPEVPVLPTHVAGAGTAILHLLHFEIKLMSN